MNPISRIANLITEDVNTIQESLYGFPTQDGNHPVDKLISHIDQAYMDFDPKDPKFQQLATKLLGGMPTPEQWSQLIMASSQSDQLKRKLIEVVGGKAPEAPQAAQAQPQAQPQAQQAVQMAQGQQQPQGKSYGFQAYSRGVRGRITRAFSPAAAGNVKQNVTVNFHRGTKIQLLKMAPYGRGGNTFIGELAGKPGHFITFHKKNVASVV